MPILTKGWDQFIHFYNIISNPLMSYTYLRNSLFQIKLFNGSTPKSEYPRYHRLTTSSLKDLTFEVDMPDTMPINSKLVNILSFIIISKLLFSYNIYYFLNPYPSFQILPPDLALFFPIYKP